MSNPTEAKIRQEQIDPELKKAGWDVHNPDQVGIEIPVDGFDPEAWNRLAAQLNQLKAQHQIYEGPLPRPATRGPSAGGDAVWGVVEAGV